MFHDYRDISNHYGTFDTHFFSSLLFSLFICLSKSVSSNYDKREYFLHSFFRSCKNVLWLIHMSYSIIILKKWIRFSCAAQIYEIQRSFFDFKPALIVYFSLHRGWTIQDYGFRTTFNIVIAFQFYPSLQNISWPPKKNPTK